MDDKLTLWPPPHHADFTGETWALGRVALRHSPSVDPWAMEGLSERLESVGAVAIHHTALDPPKQADTVVTLTTDQKAVQETYERCQKLLGDVSIADDVKDQAYLLTVEDDGSRRSVTVAAWGVTGLAYGAQALGQLVLDDGPKIVQATVIDFPGIARRVYAGTR